MYPDYVPEAAAELVVAGDAQTVLRQAAAHHAAVRLEHTL
jgi:hypothetical protein